MHKLKSLALLALAGLGLSAFGGVTTNDWWDVDFESPTPADSEGYGGVNLVIGELGPLTNNYRGASAQQPYKAGLWTMVDGDESYVTNEFNPTGDFGGDFCLKLDTQGNDLTWSVDQDNTMGDGLKALVDADLYLVGSDSPPDASDFDSANDVQTAVYLKNETNEDTGETTNSVLCVYVRDTVTGDNYWQELDGVPLDDNAWAHVQVLVDHSEDATTLPTVMVFVNGTPMHARDGVATSWTAANGSNSQTAGRVSSVAFRGTGAVDNFVGQTILETFSSYDFTAEVYMNGHLQAAGENGNVTRVVNAESGAGKKATFEGFVFHDQHWDDTAIDPETGEPGAYVVSYALTRIDFINLVDGTTETLTYGYNREDGVIVPTTVSPKVEFDVETAEDEETQEEYEYYSGPFKVIGSTEGANADSTIVKIYFEDLPEEGDFKLTASQNVGTAPADQKFNVNDANLPANATFTFAEAITDGGVGYILSKIKPGTALAGAITMAYESPSAVVTVPLADTIAEGTYNVATATYVEGTLGDQILGYEWDAENGEWTFTKKDKPVAMIGAVEYPSLRAAIAAAQAGDTIVMVADDNVSFTAATPKLVIEQAVTIDGGSNTLYGVSASGDDDWHEILVKGSGDVTIKNLAFTEFGDAATDIYVVYPICTSSTFTGKLTLDGVTFDKFARTALNLCGGTFEITNCVITGIADTSTADKFFQSAIETYFATGTVAATTVTGIGAKGYVDPDSGEDYCAAVFTLNSSSPGLPGAGKITVLSGDYSGQFVVAGMAESTGEVILSNGTFVATEPTSAANPTSAFTFDGTGATLTIAGGWFDREPEAAYIVAGLTAVEDADNAPDPAATWTVKAAAVQIEGDTTKSFLSIAEAQAAAATAGIDDPVFVIVAPLSAETVTLAAAEDTLTVKTDDSGFLANLEVVTSLAGSDAVEYGVEPRTVGMEPPITVTYMVVPTYYVAKIVDGETTTKYKTFTAAATVAMAETPTLVVEMVANTNAVEDAFAITGSLKVKAGEFLIPELVPEDRSHYLDVSDPDENGVVTYTSTAYLTATFVNGDGSTLQELDVKVGGVPIPTFDFGDVEPYPAAQPGYVVNFAMTWTPALGPIYEDTVFRPNFTTNVMDYSIQYVLGDGAAWPTGYTPPEWYAVTNATIELPSPVKDGWTFKGWYTNKTAGVYVGDLVNPGTIPAGSYGPKFFYAEFEEDATEVKVDAGDGLKDYVPEPGETVPAPIEFTEPASAQEEPLCQISFVAPEAGTYVLLSSTTVNGTYTEDAGSAKAVAKGELTTLTETSPSATGAKFFKIGYTK